jgi:hypothetical protein
LLLPDDLSKETKKVIDHLTVGRSTADVRKERVDQVDYTTAFDYLTQFYKEREAIDLTREDEEMGDEASREDGEANVDGMFVVDRDLTSSASVRACQLSEAGGRRIVYGRKVYLR